MLRWLRRLWASLVERAEVDIARVEMDGNCPHQPIGHCPECSVEAMADRW